MCIRDRYQRRVHGDILQMRISIVAVLLFAALVAICEASIRDKACSGIRKLLNLAERYVPPNRGAPSKTVGSAPSNDRRVFSSPKPAPKPAPKQRGYVPPDRGAPSRTVGSLSLIHI
eukprot:TRINITY_DN2513_c0_g1_i9.p1 TRINITY_DN2513_c0_g1~~TRINITY_DN2513_c0_g1_i9.p1  ORF type:complete len:117 (-),score=34.54 TRINITY_DN2513_c0_g1_i9:214-564(-)